MFPWHQPVKDWLNHLTGILKLIFNPEEVSVQNGAAYPTYRRKRNTKEAFLMYFCINTFKVWQLFLCASNLGTQEDTEEGGGLQIQGNLGIGCCHVLMAFCVALLEIFGHIRAALLPLGNSWNWSVQKEQRRMYGLQNSPWLLFKSSL